mgnify:CR=1 FL=1
MKIKYNSICVCGVDGTGKSTIVKMIADMFENETSVVQYMGQKNWETRIAKFIAENPLKVIRIVRPIAVIVEYYYRVYKHNGLKKIVIFDRYVDELMISLIDAKGWKRRIVAKMYKFFLGNKFYHPTITFYLTCDIEISLSRKDDIKSNDQIESLKKIKRKLDEYYINKETVVINTGLNSIENTLKIIKNNLQMDQYFCTFLI